MKKIIEKKTFVFLGPTLSSSEAKQILPNAYYLPPIQCGDIFRIMRLSPAIIIIIDGFFERCSAVWHKEILFAIEKGVLVIGASSMGALRAAELSEQGMVGVGKIYEAYLSGDLLDDDEVAVSHLSRQQNYQSNNIPLVNWRATLSSAVDKELIKQSQAEILLNDVRSIFYPERTLPVVIKKIKKHNLSESIVDDIVNQKKLDAIQALKFVAAGKLNSVKKIEMPRTLFVRSLMRQIGCQAFPDFYDWLPEHEKVISVSRLLDDIYRLSKRLAYLMATVYSLDQEEDNINKKEVEKKVLQLMKLSGDYKFFKTIDFFKKNKPIKYKIINETAKNWLMLEMFLNTHSVFPFDDMIQRYSFNFRRRYGLIEQDSLKNWLHENSLSSQSYSELLIMLIRFDYFVTDNNDLPVSKISKNDEAYWLQIALEETGAYELAKQLLCDQHQFEQAFSNVFDQYRTKGVRYLHSIDFDNESCLTLFSEQIRTFAQIKQPE